MFFIELSFDEMLYIYIYIKERILGFNFKSKLINFLRNFQNLD